jgi:hypothetical protein
MSDNTIEFSKIYLIKDNNENDAEKALNNKDQFHTELNKLKQKFNKLQLSVKNIINQKKFHFSDLIINNANIQQLKSNSEPNNKTTSSNTFNKDKNNINNNSDSNNIILIKNIERDMNTYNNIDYNINNSISSIPSSFSQKEIIKENNICHNNKLFIVKTSKNSKNNKKLLGNKTNKTERKNKKEELINQIVVTYNNIKSIVEQNGNNFKIRDKNKDIKTIIIDEELFLDIYINKGDIKKIYSYQNNNYYKKPKDIIEQLKNIHNHLENKLICLGLTNNIEN